MVADAEDRYRHLVFVGAKPSPPPPGGARSSLAAQRPAPNPRPSQPDLRTLTAAEQALFAQVLDRAGLDVRLYRSNPMKRRLGACLRALQAASPEEAATLLERRSHLLPAALNALLIGTSELYRDKPAFDCLRESILPDLLDEKNCLRVCSAACSDGAEVYTVAALLAEMGHLAKSHIVGMDCRRSAIEQARAGLFAPASMRGLPAELCQRHFQHEARGFRASRSLRERIQWKVMDVFACRDVAKWDMILCRNLAIYLEIRAAERLWTILHQALRPGGILMVGKAEKPATAGFTRAGPCIYRRSE